MIIYILEGPQLVDTSKYTGINFKDRVVGSSTPSKDKINPSLLADVDKAAIIAGTKASVTTAVTGHRPGSRHNPGGLAVDLAMFDGKGYGSKEDAKKKGIYDKIEKFVKALESMGYKVNSERGNDKAVLWFGFPNHHHHVHVSRLSDDGTSTSSSSSSEDSDNNSDDSSETTKTTTSPPPTDSKPKGLDFNTLGLISALGRLSENKKNKNMGRLLNEIEKINRINKVVISEGALQVSYPKIVFTPSESNFQNTNKNLLTDLNSIGSEKNITVNITGSTPDSVYVILNDVIKSKLTEKGYGGGKTQNPNKYYMDYNGSIYVFNNTVTSQTTDSATTTTTTKSSTSSTTNTTTLKIDTSSAQTAADSLIDSVLSGFVAPFATSESVGNKKEKLLNEINRIKKNMI